MTTETQGHAPDELQFDRAVPLAPAGDRVACGVCRAPLTSEYHTVDGTPVCAGCRVEVEAAALPVREWTTVGVAAVFGFVAAVAGAAIYYGVIALFNLEIGLVAILTGFMVGTAVRKGAGGRGGRRLQVLAAGLTYLSVAMAYLPLAIQGATEQEAAAAPAVSSSHARGTASPLFHTAAFQAPPPADPAASAAAEETEGSAGMLALSVVLLTLALPVLMVIGTFPSGLLSALIIGFGILQAWKMTGATRPNVQGPFRLGAPVPTPEPQGG